MKKLNELKKNKKGFTLMEMIVVIVIIGILMAILVPGIVKWIGKAKDVQIEADARTAYLAVQGEVYSEFKTKDAAAAVGAVNNDTKLGEILKEAGVDGKATVLGASDYDAETAHITKFTYTTKDGKKQAVYENNTWEVSKPESKG